MAIPFIPPEALNLDLAGINSGFMDATGGSTMGGGSGYTPQSNGSNMMGNIGKGGDLLTGLFGAYLGYRQLQLAKQDLNFRRDAFQKQFNVQKNLTNSKLEDRNNRRLAEGLTTRSTADFMAQYGVK